MAGSGATGATTGATGGVSVGAGVGATATAGSLGASATVTALSGTGRPRRFSASAARPLAHWTSPGKPQKVCGGVSRAPTSTASVPAAASFSTACLRRSWLARTRSPTFLVSSSLGRVSHRASASAKCSLRSRLPISRITCTRSSEVTRFAVAVAGTGVPPTGPSTPAGTVATGVATGIGAGVGFSWPAGVGAKAPLSGFGLSTVGAATGAGSGGFGFSGSGSSGASTRRVGTFTGPST